MLNKDGFIIQARMGSKRLPGKSLKKINNIPILIKIIRSLKRKKKFKDILIIVATTNLKIDDIIVKLSLKENVIIFRGSHNNVLERYYLAAKKYRLKNIIRLTSDNPFVDTLFLEKLIQLHIKNKNDYTSSKETLPIGMGAEILTFRSLKKAYKFSTSKKDKEHVCDYILDNTKNFKIQNLKFKISSKKIKKLRLTVDTQKDLIFNRNFFNSKIRTNLRKFIKYDSASN
tara:strand:+ start:70 stop:756 length:687 start_codon:yes stop_codon:yes gene_type:complete